MMQAISLIVTLTVLTRASVTGYEYNFTDPNHPIKYVIAEQGTGNQYRTTHLAAVIENRHVTNTRTNFPRSGWLENYFQAVSAPGDERGHLVGSQFSGPIDWYNLSPQAPVVNRNMGQRYLNTDWFRTECEVRKWLDADPARVVHWTVDMTYQGNSNRPYDYRLRVDFIRGDGTRAPGIDTTMRNLLRGEQAIFYQCRCPANRRGRRGADEQCDREDDYDELGRRRRRELITGE